MVAKPSTACASVQLIKFVPLGTLFYTMSMILLQCLFYTLIYYIVLQCQVNRYYMTVYYNICLLHGIALQYFIISFVDLVLPNQIIT